MKYIHRLRVVLFLFFWCSSIALSFAEDSRDPAAKKLDREIRTTSIDGRVSAFSFFFPLDDLWFWMGWNENSGPRVALRTNQFYVGPIRSYQSRPGLLGWTLNSAGASGDLGFVLFGDRGSGLWVLQESDGVDAGGQWELEAGGFQFGLGADRWMASSPSGSLPWFDRTRAGVSWTGKFVTAGIRSLALRIFDGRLSYQESCQFEAKKEGWEAGCSFWRSDGDYFRREDTWKARVGLGARFDGERDGLEFLKVFQRISCSSWIGETEVDCGLNFLGIRFLGTSKISWERSFSQELTLSTSVFSLNWEPEGVFVQNRDAWEACLAIKVSGASFGGWFSAKLASHTRPGVTDREADAVLSLDWRSPKRDFDAGLEWNREFRPLNEAQPFEIYGARSRVTMKTEFRF